MFPLKKEGSQGGRWCVFLWWPLGGTIGPGQPDDSGTVICASSPVPFTHKLGVYKSGLFAFFHSFLSGPCTRAKEPKLFFFNGMK